jgi:hypothetical protein
MSVIEFMVIQVGCSFDNWNGYTWDGVTISDIGSRFAIGSGFAKVLLQIRKDLNHGH